MKIVNTLPLFLSCLEKWTKLPSEKEFNITYAKPMQAFAGDFFEDFYSVLLDLDWPVYRHNAIKLNSIEEETRVRSRLSDVENFFKFKLDGEILILGTFAAMDGFARFSEGAHKVFLGVDESHGRGKYLDVLIAHELTHVARETRPEVWTGLGLNPKMSRSLYLQSVPVVEHLFSEGLSCLVSELLTPGESLYAYVYQDKLSLEKIFKNLDSVTSLVRKVLKDPEQDFGTLYSSRAYSPPLPTYSHYVWAWLWVKHLANQYFGGDASQLVGVCSADFLRGPDGAFDFAPSVKL